MLSSVSRFISALSMAAMINILALVAVFLLVGSPAINGQWSPATATFYDGSGGACGYDSGLYGTSTVALSQALYNSGKACGACYEVQCVNSAACLAERTTQVTATNLCPSNGQGGQCDGSKQHFDLTVQAFTQIALQAAGQVPIQYRRVPCKRSGGVAFTQSSKGNAFFNLVLIKNVAGAGDIAQASMKGLGAWCTMTRNFGSNWQCNSNMTGQSLSFKLILSDGRYLEFDNVAPANWQFGQTFTSNQNF